MGYSGTSSCRTVNTKALPFIGKKSNSKHPFLPHSEDGYGFRAPTQRSSSSHFIAPPEGIHFFPSIFFPTGPFSCTNLCLPTFPPSIPCLSAPHPHFHSQFLPFSCKFSSAANRKWPQHGLTSSWVWAEVPKHSWFFLSRWLPRPRSILHISSTCTCWCSVFLLGPDSLPDSLPFCLQVAHFKDYIPQAFPGGHSMIDPAAPACSMFPSLVEQHWDEPVDTRESHNVISRKHIFYSVLCRKNLCSFNVVHRQLCYPLRVNV